MFGSDATSWLIYADYLEEFGDSERASLIRSEVMEDDLLPWSWEHYVGAVGGVVGGVGGGVVGGVGGVGGIGSVVGGGGGVGGGVGSVGGGN
jgi:uncharacterized protein (TIGR02996 family)